MIALPDLSTFSQPESNRPNAISEAFVRALAANDINSSRVAYSGLLFAVGNNHAGTYHSVALGVLPVMHQILVEGSPWAQRTILEVLIELCGSFRPGPGQGTYHGQSLRELILQTVLSYRPVIDSLARSEGVASQSARELLDGLNDLANQPEPR